VPPRAPASPQPATRASWERWLGVRGAAVVGGIFLALAGILFFQYTIEHGWITPALRVAIGIAAGTGAIAAAEPLRSRGYALVAASLAGAGAVILYATIWAASRLYGLWPFGAGFAGMALVTVACCVLALRHDSQLVAALGLIGGFATPLLLSTGQDRPIPLFSYVLLLDLGFLLVARRRRWSAIGLVGLFGTFAIQFLWITERMTAATFGIGLVVLGVFALLFFVVASRAAAEERARWTISQVGALLLPFSFSLYFAQDVEFGRHLWPLAALAGLLSVGACWSSRREDLEWMPMTAAAGSVAMVWTWFWNTDLDAGRTAELGVCVLALAACFHGFVEWDARAAAAQAPLPNAKGRARAAILATLFFLLALIASKGTAGIDPRVWLLADSALVLLLYRQSALARWPSLQVAAAVLAVADWTAWIEMRPGRERIAFPPPLAFGALLVASGLALQGLVLVRRDPAGRRAAGWAACLFASAAVWLLESHSLGRGREGELFAAVLALSLSAASAAVIARSGAGYVLALVAVTARFLSLDQEFGLIASGALLAATATAAAVFVLLPVAARSRFAGSNVASYAGAAAAVVFAFLLERRFENRFGHAALPLLPLALALLAAAAAQASSRRGGAQPATRSGVLAYAAAASFLACRIVPLALERGELIVACALWAASLAFLWRRDDRPALKYAALGALLASTGARFLTRTEGRYPLYDAVLLNPLAYDFLLPAAAAVAVAIAFAPLETARLRPSERSLFSGDHAAGTGLAGLTAAALVLGWISLLVLNAFGTEPRFSLDHARLPARDMTLSIAWAVYALLLLVLGVRLGFSLLRWASLVLLIATIGKVFLIDLGSIGGLYRVASLLGLAISLLSVSLLYQRFVFRRAPVRDPA
jgi:uncharacterized membrane protein